MNELQRNELINTIIVKERLRPISRAKRLLADPLGAIPYYALAALGHIKPFKLTFKTLWGTRMTSYLPEGNTFYYYGYCEANLANFFLRTLQAGDTFIDIGAHVGFYSMLGSALVGKKGLVHSFEPTPRTFELLKKNTFSLPQVTINNNALSDKEETLSFADYGEGYGAFNTAHKNGAAHISRIPQTIHVESLVLDKYLKDHQLNPTMVKIDAEGFEYYILLGMRDTLSMTRPLLTLEVAGGEEWAENRQASFSLLSSHSYSPYEIRTDGMLSAHTLRENYGYENLVFIPKERIVEYKAFIL